jgi:AraC-like DNA-binding protein
MLWRVLECYETEPSTIVPDSLYRPGADISNYSHVSAEDYYDVLGTVIRSVDDEAVGITIARLLHPSHLGVFGHAWIASPSLIAGLRMLERFGRVFYRDLPITLRETPDVIEISFDPESRSPYPSVDADIEVGGVIKLCRIQHGDSFIPRAVSLRRPKPRQTELWDEYFGVPVEFDAAENLAVIEPEIAARTLTTAHAALFDKHKAMLAELDKPDLVMRVRLAIQQLLPSGSAPEEKVAGIVGMNPRTLHRRLSERGESFRSLLRRVRMDLARRHLLKDGFNVTEAAFMLGYSDSSAFSLSFRCWFGVSPSEFRKDQVIDSQDPAFHGR